MTDGPFKNLKLDSRLKRFAEAVQNEAEDHDTRCALGSHAIVNGILSGNDRLIRDLQSHGENGQLDLDPEGSIKSIFDKHNKSEFSDDLQRQVAMRLHEGDNSRDAIDNALEACVERHIGKNLTRIQEAGYEAHREGPMYKDQLERLIEGSNHVVKSLDRDRINEAVKSCNKNAFKQETKKITGLDDPIL
nr:hypothetical protein [Sphingomonas sp. Y57]